MRFIFTILIIFTFLTKPASANWGEGKLKLSKQTMETVIMYMYGAGNKKYSGNAKRKNKPTIMAISKSGYSYMYTYCPIEYHDGCRPPNQSRVIKACEKYSEGSPCFIFAKKRTIVWKNGNGKVRIKKKDLKNPYLVAKKIQEAGYYDGDLSELTGIDYTTGQLDNTKNITNKKTKVSKNTTNETSSELVKELKILTELYEGGSLTKEEFDIAKSKLLNN